MGIENVEPELSGDLALSWVTGKCAKDELTREEMKLLVWPT